MLSTLCPPRCVVRLPSLPPTSVSFDVCHSAYSSKWNPKTAPLVLLTIGTLTLFLLKFFMKQTNGALKQDCLGVNNKHHAAERWDLEFMFQTPQKVFSNTTKSYLSKIISYGFLLYSPVIGLDLESHSREKVQFFETRLRIIFLALTWQDEIEIII